MVDFTIDAEPEPLEKTLDKKLQIGGFRPSLGCMPRLWKHQNSGENALQPICIIDNQEEKLARAPCKYAKTRSDIYIRTPFPEVLMLNINWFSDQIGYMDSFRFSASIATQFAVGDMFLIDPADMQMEDTYYLLKGVVCFVGAHYFTFVRQQSEVAKQDWLLFDDDKPI
jgi:hypothetical protein